MHKVVKILLNWKVLLPLIIVAAVALWAAPTALRKGRQRLFRCGVKASEASRNGATGQTLRTGGFSARSLRDRGQLART